MAFRVATNRQSRCQRRFSRKLQSSSYHRKSTIIHDASKEPNTVTTNDAIEGVWVFCRHGDRTPSRPLSPNHRKEEESSFWISRLPYPDSATSYQAFSKCYPVEAHPAKKQGEFLDVGRNPFGFLTQTGLAQLKENGIRHYERYTKCRTEKTAQDFLSVWDLTVYSTNYLRTVMSGQSFLDGLLGTDCFNPARRRKLDPTISKEMCVPNHNWPKPEGNGLDTVVPIHIRLDNDPLNAFDRNPDLMENLVSEVISSNDFQTGDALAAPLATRMANILPGLVRTGLGGYAQRSPSGISWVDASDHFICRNAHGVKLSRFSDYEDDTAIEDSLDDMSHETLEHLAWRKRQWYLNKKLLAAVAAPPLREIAEQVKSAPSLDAQERRPFVLYFCHDVTLLGLLYGIGADFLHVDEQSSEWRYFWPKYGSTLAFELVRIKEDPAASNSSTHVIRVLLNGKRVLSVDAHECDKRSPAPAAGHGPQKLLLVEDFLHLVTSLENAGGHDYAELLGHK